MTSSPRIIDHMCAAHVDACLVRWPIPGEWPELVRTCEPCAERARGLRTGEALPDLSADERDRVHAVHEAGHVVSALDLGVPVEYAGVWRAGEQGQRSDGGYTRFGNDGEWFVPLIDRFTVLWAGQEAADRWLMLEGLATDANRLDVRYLARHDARAFEYMVAGEGLLVPSEMGVLEARHLVASRWERIETLAAALIVHRRLSGDEARVLVDAGRHGL